MSIIPTLNARSMFSADMFGLVHKYFVSIRNHSILFITILVRSSIYVSHYYYNRGTIVLAYLRRINER
jgi:hypothetical protein